jgi:hypothetical protein
MSYLFGAGKNAVKNTKNQGRRDVKNALKNNSKSRIPKAMAKSQKV